jgi:hypothetical protein
MPDLPSSLIMCGPKFESISPRDSGKSAVRFWQDGSQKRPLRGDERDWLELQYASVGEPSYFLVAHSRSRLDTSPASDSRCNLNHPESSHTRV